MGTESVLLPASRLSGAGLIVYFMSASPIQKTFFDLGPSLGDTTFVVFDFETTGGSAQGSRITEIGAVKVRGGETLGEFHTLVNPETLIPAQITLLTGITNAMVAQAPEIAAVLPAFTEFIKGAVLVAHNAPFDMGFLKTALERHSYPPVRNQVVDTVRLSRSLLARSEVPNHKLATLASYFQVPVPPTHRALDDARATVAVLHRLLERAGSIGVTHLEDLPQLIAKVPRFRREKAHLARSLSSGPGVYIFRDAAGSPIYIGKSTNIKRRVKSYFTGSETRKRSNELIKRTQEITEIPCATEVEARVRELRLIIEHQPPYNRHEKRQNKTPWISVTREPYPRLAIVHRIPKIDSDPPRLIGPFSSSQQARLAIEAIHDTFAIRQCTTRLPATPDPTAQACTLAQLNRCQAPCTGRQDRAEYQEIIESMMSAVLGDPELIVAQHTQRMRSLAAEQRYEEARDIRDRLDAVLTAIQRGQRISALAACSQIVAARRIDSGGWEILLARYGKLAGTATTPLGTDPRPVATALIETGSHIEPPHRGLPAGTPRETEIIHDWITSPGTRLIDIAGTWRSPVRGAGRYRDLVTALRDATRHD